jgi:SAM-dependent methyltransferase
MILETEHAMKLRIERELPLDNGCACCGGREFTLWMTVPRTLENEPDYRLLCCPSCSHTWLADPPDADELGRFYGPAYHQAISGSGTKDPVRWGRQLEIILRFKTQGSVLDIGCSSGGFLAFLRGASWQLFGIEASAMTAAIARTVTGGNIFAGDVVDAHFVDESFDVITCSDVLEHLYEPRVVFSRVSRWLKPGGIFYVFVPNVQSWEARIFRPYWYGLDLPRHLHHFSVGSLAALAQSAGLSQVHMATPRGCYLEQSASLWLNHVSRHAGFSDPKWNLSGPAPLPWRIVRKVIRLTAENLYARVASSCSAGPSLQAVFQKAPRSGLKPSAPQELSSIDQPLSSSLDEARVTL